jgi:hypothetical protein
LAFSLLLVLLRIVWRAMRYRHWGWLLDVGG